MSGIVVCYGRQVYVRARRSECKMNGLAAAVCACVRERTHHRGRANTRAYKRPFFFSSLQRARVWSAPRWRLLLRRQRAARSVTTSGVSVKGLHSFTLFQIYASNKFSIGAKTQEKLCRKMQSKIVVNRSK